MLGGALLVVVAGCDGGPSTEPTDRVWIGEVDDDTFVAVVSDDERVLAYVCDGTPEAVSVATWFVGTHDGDSFALDHASGRRFTGTIGDDAISGHLLLGDEELAYMAAPAAGAAGLFLADEADLRGGWIVHEDGAQRGAVLHRTTGDIVSAQPIRTTQTSVVLQAKASPLQQLSQPALPQ